MWTLAFLKATAERVIATAAETLLALLVVDGFGVTDLTTGATWSVVGLAALATVLKSVISATSDGNPSAFNAERLAPTG